MSPGAILWVSKLQGKGPFAKVYVTKVRISKVERGTNGKPYSIRTLTYVKVYY